LRMDGRAWSTDKDGIVPCLLAAEITARNGRDPGEAYRALVRDLGEPFADRVDAPATFEQKKSSPSSTARRCGSRILPANASRRC